MERDVKLEDLVKDIWEKDQESFFKDQRNNSEFRRSLFEIESIFKYHEYCKPI